LNFSRERDGRPGIGARDFPDENTAFVLQRVQNPFRPTFADAFDSSFFEPSGFQN